MVKYSCTQSIIKIDVIKSVALFRVAFFECRLHYVEPAVSVLLKVLTYPMKIITSVTNSYKDEDI